MENLFQKNKLLFKQSGLIQSIKASYHATPKRARFWIYPMNFLFFLMGFLSVTLFIYSSFTHERGGSLVNLLIGLFLMCLSWFIFNGTGKYWMLKSLTKQYFQEFYEKFRSTELGQQISFELHASSQNTVLVKSFDDRERYYPFICFLFSKEIEKYTCTIGSMTKTTRPGNVGSPSGYQENISFLIVEDLPKNYEESKILKKNELIEWFTNEFNVDLSLLMDYIKLMRVRENRLMLEFKDTIHIAEKKIEVLEYLDEKFQSSKLS